MLATEGSDDMFVKIGEVRTRESGSNYRVHCTTHLDENGLSVGIFGDKFCESVGKSVVGKTAGKKNVAGRGETRNKCRSK